MLTQVTLTGADNSVNPSELIQLHYEFPFVEWGILYSSESSEGTPRFPTMSWIKEFLNLCQSSGNCTKVSLHACGSFLSSIINDRENPFRKILGYQRVQLNFHGAPISIQQATNAFCGAYDERWWHEYIFQLDGVNDNHFSAGIVTYSEQKDGQKPTVSGLFDSSHGAGISPSYWRTPLPGWKVGYAGGLNLGNVTRETLKIKNEVIPGKGFWVDMETSLRARDSVGRDVFDLGMCRKILLELERTHPNLTALRASQT